MMQFARIMASENRRTKRNWLREIQATLVMMIGLAATALPVQAATFTFKDGSPTPYIGGTYTGTQDSTLSSTSAGANLGGSTNLWVGDYASGTLLRYTLIR